MENRFGIRHLQIVPYLCNLSEEELQDEPVYSRVTEDGKDDRGLSATT